MSTKMRTPWSTAYRFRSRGAVNRDANGRLEGQRRPAFPCVKHGCLRGASSMDVCNDAVLWGNIGMRIKVAYAISAGVALFVSGAAVGQWASGSKFAKYLRSANRTEMDLITLETNVSMIEQLLPMTEGMSAPTVVFDPKEGGPHASVFVSSDFEKEPLDTVKSRIHERWALAFFSLEGSVPELSKDEFVLKVYRLSPGWDDSTKLFAEYRKGQVVFH